MTQDTIAAQAAAAEAAEAAALNASLTPDQTETTTSPATEPGSSRQDPVKDEPAERPLSKREEIAAKWRKKREEELAATGEQDDFTYNEAGAEVPPFVKAMQDAEARAAEEEAAKAAAEEAEKAKAATEEKTFTIKVNGNTHTLTFAQLLEHAGVDEEEAKGLPTTSLVRAAQINAAAQENLSLAKSARKSARAPEGDTQPSDEPAGDDDDLPSNSRTTPANTPADDEAAQLMEKVQFGDPKEAAEAIRKLARMEAKTLAQEEALNAQLATVQDEITATTRTFEAANADILGDDVLAQAFYNGDVLKEIKADLVSSGKVSQEKADAVLTNVVTALEVYTAAKASNLVKVRTPTEILEAANANFRKRIGRPSAPTTTEPVTQPAPTHRRDAKRALLPPPSRSAAPQPVAKPRDAVAAKKAAIAEMRKARGQKVY